MVLKFKNEDFWERRGGGNCIFRKLMVLTTLLVEKKTRPGQRHQ